MESITITFTEEDGKIRPKSLDYTKPISVIEVVGLLEWAKSQAGLEQL